MWFWRILKSWRFVAWTAIALLAFIAFSQSINRYELISATGGIPWRLDRWTGELCHADYESARGEWLTLNCLSE